MDNQDLISAISNMEEQKVFVIVDKLIKDHVNPMEIVDSCKSAMDLIGKRFEIGEAFIPELIMAGEMAKQISNMIKPLMTNELKQNEKLGKIMIGTVKGDIHDIGKDIVVFMLDINGFEVIDLGVDVPVNTFLEKIREVRPDILGLSGLLTSAFDSMKTTVAAIDNAGLRKELKIMIGGGSMDDRIKNYVNADAWGKDAVEAVSLAKQWVRGN